MGDRRAVARNGAVAALLRTSPEDARF